MVMTAEQLIRLYPRAWRDRYGEEFLATIGDKALHLQQVMTSSPARLTRGCRPMSGARSSAPRVPNNNGEMEKPS